MRKSERSSYTPLDFLAWYTAGTLEISPKFQRRSVWSRNAKSYLIDTLLLQLPVPPIYLRIVQSADKKSMIREVIDGQQRMTAVLEFLQGKFSLASNIESPCKGKKFEELTDEEKDKITQYTFICEIFHGVGDREILQVFSRMNMNSVKLNDQELRNGKFFGAFKRTCYNLAYEHLEFWRTNKILTESNIARMKEVELTSELVISMLDGMQDKKKSIDSFYRMYDEVFAESTRIQSNFRSVIDLISEIFENDLKNLEFKRPPIFYSMFLALYHRLFGLHGSDLDTPSTGRISNLEKIKFRETILELSDAVKAYKSDQVSPDERNIQRFIDACITSTDSLPRRQTRMNTIYEMAF